MIQLSELNKKYSLIDFSSRDLLILYGLFNLGIFWTEFGIIQHHLVCKLNNLLSLRKNYVHY